MKPSLPIVSAQGVVKRFGPLVALDGVSLDIAPGEFFGLLGPNGAGKSTFMSLIAGLRPLDAGTLTVNDAGVAAGSAEGPALDRPRSPAHRPLLGPDRRRQPGDLRRPRRSAGTPAAAGADRPRPGLAPVQLSDRRRDLVKTFFGGMQRRLNLAAALLHGPKLLLCDEPTVGVDPQSRNAIFDFLQALNREGMTVIYSTHYMEEATRLCSRIGIIDHGKILALGTIDELLARLPFEEEIRFPATPETATLGDARIGGPRRAGDRGRRPPLPPAARISAQLLLLARRESPAGAPPLRQPAPHPRGALPPADRAGPARIT